MFFTKKKKGRRLGEGFYKFQDLFEIVWAVLVYALRSIDKESNFDLIFKG